MRRRFNPLTVTTLASLAGLSFLAACSDTTAPSSLRAGAAALTLGPTPNAPGSVGVNFSSSGSTQYCGGTAGAFTIPATITVPSGCGTASDLQTALLAYNPGWDANLTGSSWIGPNATSNEYKTLPGTYVFQTTFNLNAGVTNVVLNDTLLSDNAVAVYLNGTKLEQQVIADCATGINCNWNTSNKFVISASSATVPGGGFVVGTNTLTVYLVDTPNGGNAGNNYDCTKLPQTNGSIGFTQSNNVPTAPNHVYAGFVPGDLAAYKTAGCQNPTGLDFSGRVSWVVPTTLQWCSPGFWKNHLNAWSLADQQKLYSTLGAGRAPLSKKAPAGDPNLRTVLENPNLYGGPATNSVADYLSGKAFGANVGTSADDANCNDGVPLTPPV